MKVHEEHKKKGPKLINLALIIVSTSRYNEIQEKTESSDKTIPLVKHVLSKHTEFSLNTTEIVSDDSKQIRNVLDKLLKESGVSMQF